MSYDLGLYYPNETPAMVARHKDGGTYRLGGSGDAELNITYNYSPHYYKWLDPEKGLRWLYGQKAQDCIERLEFAVTALGVERDNDYWKATEGNAGYALSILLSWARQHPGAVFNGD